MRSSLLLGVCVLPALVACKDRPGAQVDAASASSASSASAVDLAPSASASVDAAPIESTSPNVAAIPSATGDVAPLLGDGGRPAEAKPTFRKSKVDTPELARIFGAIPELSRVASDVQLFDPNDGSYLLRSEAPHPGIVFTTVPLLYSPEPGMDLLVATGRSHSTSFVVALWVLPQNEYRLASYFLMLHDIAPIALAYSEKGKRLWWTSCWNCPGEQGHLRITDDHHVIIVQQ